LPIVVVLLLFALALTAGVVDIRVRRIPNWLVLTGLIAGITVNSVLFGWPGLKLALSGAGFAFAVYFVFYLLRAMGAGDVKLMAAVGALAGLKGWLAIFFFTAIAGGVVALTLLLAKGRFRQTLLNVSIMLYQLSRLQAPYHATEELDVRSGKALRLPHGASIAMGTFIYLTVVLLYHPPGH
jgi:prepilin peptidase CpaA